MELCKATECTILPHRAASKLENWTTQEHTISRSRRGAGGRGGGADIGTTTLDGDRDKTREEQPVDAGGCYSSAPLEDATSSSNSSSAGTWGSVSDGYTSGPANITAAEYAITPQQCDTVNSSTSSSGGGDNILSDNGVTCTESSVTPAHDANAASVTYPWYYYTYSPTANAVSSAPHCYNGASAPQCYNGTGAAQYYGTSAPHYYGTSTPQCYGTNGGTIFGDSFDHLSTSPVITLPTTGQQQEGGGEFASGSVAWCAECCGEVESKVLCDLDYPDHLIYSYTSYTAPPPTSPNMYCTSPHCHLLPNIKYFL